MHSYTRYGLGLALGTLGGFGFWYLNLPLPWMLGSLLTTMVATVAGLPIIGPNKIRPYVIAVIGVMLGARFSPEVLGQLATWTGTILTLFVYLLVVALAVVPWYRFIGGYDWRTSFFAGMPGGLAEMVEMGEAKGADVKAIILAHSLRIVVTITLIAVWFRVIQGHQVGGGSLGAGISMEWHEALLLLGAAVVGTILGKLLHMPAPHFLGPMAVSAGLHLFGISEAAPPSILVNAAQIVLGTVLGCRFFGVPLRNLWSAGWLSLGSTVISLAIAMAFSWLMLVLFTVDPQQAILALAPGGLTEMGLIALAIHADVAFVALHHVVRIFAILLGVPLFLSVMERRGATRPD